MRLLLFFLTSFFTMFSGLCSSETLRLGAERMELLIPMLQGKRVALFVNQSSVVGKQKTHLLDTLLAQGIRIERIFVPEHGFRGDVDAGKSVRHGRDTKTGIPITSLYGKVKRPTAEMLKGIDLVLYDIQDVGVRFYTYISSLHYMMEAVAEQGKNLIVADRPNPVDYIDGPVLEADCRSFVGMHPIPIAYGLTVAELAQMINGERWLRGRRKCKLQLIPMQGWQHGDSYELPVRPSPNLQDARAIALYPTLCLFEATIMSVGRGTDTPFRVLGYPNKGFGSFSFIPEVKLGADTAPRYKGQYCYGEDFTERKDVQTNRLSLGVLIDYYQKAKVLGLKLIDRPRMFELLVGNKHLQRQLDQGMGEEAIRATWASDLKTYKKKRQKYLLYPDTRK